jgi:hypothetical protein
MEKASKRHKDYSGDTHPPTEEYLHHFLLQEQWKMTAEICKRLDVIEASSHDHQAN